MKTGTIRFKWEGFVAEVPFRFRRAFMNVAARRFSVAVIGYILWLYVVVELVGYVLGVWQ